MPLQQREFIQLSLLLLCVPLQYYLSNFSKSIGEEDRSRTIIKTFTEIENFVGKYFSLGYWTEKSKALASLIFADLIGVNYVSKLKGTGSDSDDGTRSMDEKEEEETIRLFSLETVHSTVHDERPDDLKYRIGQVIEHGPFSIRGVIVGWEYHDKESKYKQPIYTILMNELPTEDGHTSFMEVPQKDIILLQLKQANHRHLKRYFKTYDGTQYLPHDWLRRLYPND